MKKLIYLITFLASISASAQYIDASNTTVVGLTEKNTDSIMSIDGDGKMGYVLKSQLKEWIGEDVIDSINNNKQIKSVSDISDLEAFSGVENYIIVTDTLRGGFFYYEDVVRNVDNGVIFEAIGKESGVWVRSYENNEVNVMWWGANPYDEELDDVAIQLALDYVDNIGGGVVSFPTGTYYVILSGFIGSNTTLEGNGSLMVGVHGSPAAENRNYGTFATKNYESFEMLENITIRNFSFTKNIVACLVDNLLIENCRKEGGDLNNHFMDLSAIKNSVIRNNYCDFIYNSGAIQIESYKVGGSYNFSVRDDTGVVQVTVPEGSFSENVLVQNNVVKNTAIGYQVHGNGNKNIVFDGNIYEMNNDAVPYYTDTQTAAFQSSNAPDAQFDIYVINNIIINPYRSLDLYSFHTGMYIYDNKIINQRHPTSEVFVNLRGSNYTRFQGMQYRNNLVNGKMINNGRYIVDADFSSENQVVQGTNPKLSLHRFRDAFPGNNPLSRTPLLDVKADGDDVTIETLEGDLVLKTAEDLFIPHIAAPASQTYILVIDDDAKVGSIPMPTGGSLEVTDGDEEEIEDVTKINFIGATVIDNEDGSVDVEFSVDWDDIGGDQSDIDLSGFTNDSNYIAEGSDSEETIEYISVVSEAGSEANTLYIVPKLHLVAKEGQLSIWKYTGNTAPYPEENDRVEGFMEDDNEDVWFVIGRYSGSGSFFLTDSYELLNGSAKWD